MTLQLNYPMSSSPVSLEWSGVPVWGEGGWAWSGGPVGWGRYVWSEKSVERGGRMGWGCVEGGGMEGGPLGEERVEWGGRCGASGPLEGSPVGWVCMA